jgi:hypothetical protein
VNSDPVIAERASRQLRWILPYRASLLGLTRPAPVDGSATVNTFQYPADPEAWAILEAFRKADDQPIEATATVAGPAVDVVCNAADEVRRRDCRH